MSDSLQQMCCQEAARQQMSDSLQQVYCQEAARQQLSDSLHQVCCHEAAGQLLSAAGVLSGGPVIYFCLTTRQV